MSDTLNAIIAAMETGESSAFEAACDFVRAARQRGDAMQFTIGDIAAAVETHYGRGNLGELAKNANISRSAIYEYAKVASLVAPDLRQEYGALLGWTHFRMAARIAEFYAVADFLELCASEGLTADQATRKAKELRGVELPPETLFNGEAVIPSVNPATGTITIKAAHAGDSAVGLMEAARSGEIVKVVIKRVKVKEQVE